MLLAALYFVLAKLALFAAIPPGYATSVWPPSGLALAAVLLLGPRVWPGVWLGAALVNLTVQTSVVAALLIGTGNALEALAGAALIRRYLDVPARFERGEDVFKFAALVAVAATIAASIGALSIALIDAAPAAALPGIWWTWWQGDVSGMIVVTPLILAWAVERRDAWSRRRILELCALALGFVLAAYIAFGSGLVSPSFSPLALALTLPLIIWVAFRFGQAEVVLTIAALASIAVADTVAGRGPLVGAARDEALWQLLLYISIIAVTGLAISAVVGERRAAMAALRRSHDELAQRVDAHTRDATRTEETFRLLVDGIQDYAIFMLDTDGNVASWNRGAQRIKGYRADEIIGQHLSRFYPQEAIDRQWPQQELALARAQGRFEDEGWRLRKDGTQFWANVIITALRDPEGNLRGFAKVTRDMTERKRMEALEGSERRVNEFLAMLAHELRNPLAPIRNALDLMRMRAGPETSQPDVWARTIIDRQVTQLTCLVDDLLDVGRITSGKIVLKKEPIDLDAAVKRAVEACQPAAEARHQTIGVQPSGDAPSIDGDPIRITQVVLNLLNNAIKYTQDGGRIDVTVTRDGDWAVLRVRDTGIGMPPELLSNVFDLFVQGERSLARTEGGLGIGLTVVRQLVALHGGTVVAQSDGVGKGSEFIVLLPALPIASRKAPAPPPARVAAPTLRRVIVVDDNRDSADMLAALLAAFGHEARAAYDGPSALAAATADPPDAMLVDIGLPGMNGYEVAQRVRATPALQRIVLIAFTGYGQDEDRRRARDAGFDHHLVKPVDPTALEKLVASIPALAAGR